MSISLFWWILLKRHRVKLHVDMLLTKADKFWCVAPGGTSRVYIYTLHQSTRSCDPAPQWGKVKRIIKRISELAWNLSQEPAVKWHASVGLINIVSPYLPG